jgi:hypothetical protein
MTSGAIMPRARTMALDATGEIPDLPEQMGLGDPFDELVERMRPVAVRSVDALQVAAALETSGVTDRAARVEYGYLDVFDLAEEICRRVGPAADPPPAEPARRWVAELRDIGHGALYLLPVTTFPIAFAALGGTAFVSGVVLAAGLGWVWSGAAAWLAYRLIGDGHHRSAGRLLRWATLAAVPVAAALTALLAEAVGVGNGLVVMVAIQLAYQMAVTTLVFYHREVLAFASMLPAAIAGIAYLVVGEPLLAAAIWVGIGSVVLAFGLAVGQTTGRGDGTEPPLGDTLRGQFRRFLAVVVFTALSAAFFLYPQARHLVGPLDVAIATLPVIVGMGVVEWRAHRFAVDARALLARVGHPGEFVVRVWLIVLSGLVTCLVAASALAAVLLAALAGIGQLGAAGAVMAVSAVLLAGTYYLGFLLANLARYTWLSGSLLLCLVLYAVAGQAVTGGGLGDVIAFLAATALLFLLYLAALAGSVGDAHRHR